MKRHFSIRISGVVQGVFFRASTKAKADELDIKGIVRNERDGSVYVEAEGEEKNLDEFIQWCRKGPARASVEKYEVDEGPPKGIPVRLRQYHSDYEFIMMLFNIMHPHTGRNEKSLWGRSALHVLQKSLRKKLAKRIPRRN